MRRSFDTVQPDRQPLDFMNAGTEVPAYERKLPEVPAYETKLQGISLGLV